MKPGKVPGQCGVPGAGHRVREASRLLFFPGWERWGGETARPAGQGRQPGPKGGALFEIRERGPSLHSGPFCQALGTERDLRDGLCGQHSGGRWGHRLRTESQCRGPLVVTGKPGWPEVP